ncbi:MAG: LysM domain-containing protein [Novosphingobium sp.]
MAFDSALDAVSEVEALQAQFDIAVAAATAADGAEISPADALSVVAGLDGVRQDGRAVLADLDTTQEEDILVVQDANVLIQLWLWRRNTRKSMMAALGRCRELSDIAYELVQGKRQKVIVTRQGDTLQRIAARELGDWREWPRILDANPGLAPGDVPSGTSLVIPERR